MRASVAHGSREGVAEQRELDVASDEPRGDAAQWTAALSGCRDCTPDLHLVREAREPTRACTFQLDGARCKAPGAHADEDLLRPGDVLEANRRVEGVPGGDGSDVVAVDDDVGGFHAHPTIDLEPPGGRLDLEGRSKRALRVVLVHERHAEDSHDHGSAELLDGSAVRFDAARDELEESSYPAAGDAEVGADDQRCRPGEADDEH